MRSMCGADAGCLAINYQSLLEPRPKQLYLDATSPVRCGVSLLSSIYWNGPRPSCRPELTEGFQSTNFTWMYEWSLSEFIYFVPLIPLHPEVLLAPRYSLFSRDRKKT